MHRDQATDFTSFKKRYAKPKTTSVNPKNIPRCKCCNMPGDHGGFCEMHYEQQAELSYRQRMESYRVPGKNDFEIDVLTGKVIPELQPKQEEADEDIPF